MNPLIILCTLTLLGFSNATFFGLGGGGGDAGGSIKSALQSASAPVQSHGPAHGRPQVIKVILQTQNHGGDESHGHSGGHGGHAEYIKVIHQSAERSNGHGYASNYNHGYEHGHGSGSNSNSKIIALLPQILQIVLADEGHGKHGGSGGYGGHGGSFFSTMSKGADFYRGGHVIEKGTLELKRIPNAPSSGGKDKGALLSALPALLNSGGQGGQQSGGWSSNYGSSGWNSGSSGWSSGSSGW